MRMSKNFISEEFLCPCCNQEKMDMKFIRELQNIRDMYGKPMKITSGYRCERHNKNVGGSKKSKHMLGIAVDIIVTTNEDAYRLVQLAMSVGMSGIGVGLPLGGDYGKRMVHIDMRQLHDYPPSLWSY